MPELAEVEVARRNVERWWKDQAATQVHVLDERLLVDTTAQEITQILTRKLLAMDRRGKYLIARFEGDYQIVFHFRMTGKIIRADIPETKYTRLAWLIPPIGWLIFKDQRCLGTLHAFKPGELDDYRPLSDMGPEPHDVDAPRLKAILPPKRQLKAALMDQAIIAGVGNIAISEIFWRVKIPPKAKVSDLSEAQISALATEMPRYFDEVIEASMADEIVYLEEKDGDNIFDVYGRQGEPCPRCGTPIERIVLGGRSSYFCPACQA